MCMVYPAFFSLAGNMIMLMLAPILKMGLRCTDEHDEASDQSERGYAKVVWFA